MSCTRLNIIKNDTTTWQARLSGGGDLSAAQGVTVFMWQKDDPSNLVIDGQAGVIVSATAMAVTVEYAPEATEVDTEGFYELQWEVTFPGSKVARFPSGRPMVVVIGTKIE